MFPRMCRKPPWMNMEVRIVTGRSSVRNNAIGGDEVIHLPAIQTQTELVQKHQHVRDDQQQCNGGGRVMALGGP